MSQSDDPLASWPKGCAIQAEDPSSSSERLLLEQPPLGPGRTLRASSGSDVHWARGASVKSSSSTSSSSSSAVKYLALLPGVLSLNPPTELEDLNDQGKSEDPGQAVAEDPRERNSPTDVVTLVLGEEATQDKETAKPPEGAASTRTRAVPPTTSSRSSNPTNNSKDPPPPATVLGRLHRPDLQTATLNLHGGLQLQGRHIKTMGKFLVLTMQPRKKRVICKHVFESILVFGNPSIAAQTQTAPTPEDAAAVAPPNVLHHYGGSSRTVDGGGGDKKGAKTSRQGQLTSADISDPKPILVLGNTHASIIKGRNGRGDDTGLSSSSSSSDREVNVTAAEPLSFRRSSRAASQKPVRYSDALQLSSDDDDDDGSGTNSGADDRKPGTKIKTSSDERSRDSDDNRKAKSRPSTLKSAPPATRKQTPASKPKVVPPRKTGVDSGDSFDDNTSKPSLPVSVQTKAKALVRNASSGQPARIRTAGAGSAGNRKGSYAEDDSESSAEPTAAAPARQSTRPQRSTTRRGSSPPSADDDHVDDEASSTSASSSDHDEDTARKPVKPKPGKPLKAATMRRRDNKPEADKQVFVVDDSDSDLHDNVLVPKSSKVQERAPATIKNSSRSSPATRTTPKNALALMRNTRPVEALLARHSQALSENVQVAPSTDDDGHEGSQPSPAAAPSTGKRKRQTFGSSSGGEPSPRIKKKEIGEKVDVTLDSDDDGLPEEPNTRNSNGTSNRKWSVLESPEELTQRKDSLLRTKAVLSKTSSPISASSHPATPLRFRRSPPKPKKRLSVLDYAKDEGFL